MAPTSDRSIARRKHRACADGSPAQLDRRTCLCLSPTLRPWIRPGVAARRHGVGPTWRGVGARSAFHRRVSAAFSLGRGLGHIFVFFKLGITFLVLSLVVSRRNEKERPVWAALVGRSPIRWRLASGRTSGRGADRSGCENGSWSCRWLASQPDLASKVAHVPTTCKCLVRCLAGTLCAREGSPPSNLGRKLFFGLVVRFLDGPSDLQAAAVGATFAHRMSRLIHIERSDFMPAPGGYECMLAAGRPTNQSTRKRT